MAIDRAKTLTRTLRGMALRSGAAELTDGQLLGCFIDRRDEASFEALVRRHGSMVLGVCRRLLRHGQDAEDAFQAVFIVLVRKAASIRKREQVGAWLYSVAHQTALKARAAAAKRRSRERQVTAMPEPEATNQDSDADLSPALDRELSRLPEKYRVPIILCELEGKTHGEAARQLGCREGTVSVRLSRGRAMLARRLTRCGLAVTAATATAALSQSTASAAVSPLLLAATVKTATLLAAGGATAAAVSAHAAALASGVLKTLLLKKIRIAAVLLFTGGLIVLAAGSVACRAIPTDAGRNALESPPLATSGQPAPAFAPVASDAPVDGKAYLVVNVASNRCLSVHDREKQLAMIVLGPAPRDAGRAEQWRLVQVGDYFQLVNGNSGMALSLPAGQAYAGVQPVQENVVGPQNRQTPVPLGNDNPPRASYGGFPQLRIEDEMWQLAPAGDHYCLQARLGGMALGLATPWNQMEPTELRQRAAERKDQTWDLRRVP